MLNILEFIDNDLKNAVDETRQAIDCKSSILTIHLFDVYSAASEGVHACGIDSKECMRYIADKVAIQHWIENYILKHGLTDEDCEDLKKVLDKISNNEP